MCRYKILWMKCHWVVRWLGVDTTTGSHPFLSLSMTPSTPFKKKDMSRSGLKTEYKLSARLIFLRNLLSHPNRIWKSYTSHVFFLFFSQTTSRTDYFLTTRDRTFILGESLFHVKFDWTKITSSCDSNGIGFLFSFNNFSLKIISTSPPDLVILIFNWVSQRLEVAMNKSVSFPVETCP